jgi:hypothetical protein
MASAAPQIGHDTRARLQATGERLQREATGALRTLDPARELATPLFEVHRRTLHPLAESLAAQLDEPLADGLCGLALAQLDAFPGNLFWDLDLIAVAVVAQAHALEPDAAAELVRDRFTRMIELQRLYGRATAINFSYVHDFVYGFDWAKWVAREPELHADVPGPFSLRFLEYMDQRGHELLELIAEDDRKYPNLPEDQARNPFPFSREPEAEIELHRELARRDLIPVPAWDPQALALDWGERWRVPFQDRRVEVATELGLA